MLCSQFSAADIRKCPFLGAQGLAPAPVAPRPHCLRNITSQAAAAAAVKLPTTHLQSSQRALEEVKAAAAKGVNRESPGRNPCSWLWVHLIAGCRGAQGTGRCTCG